jgi:hypothetical protein
MCTLTDTQTHTHTHTLHHTFPQNNNKEIAHDVRGNIWNKFIYIIMFEANWNKPFGWYKYMW